MGGRKGGKKNKNKNKNKGHPKHKPQTQQRGPSRPHAGDPFGAPRGRDRGGDDIFGGGGRRQDDLFGGRRQDDLFGGGGGRRQDDLFGGRRQDDSHRSTPASHRREGGGRDPFGGPAQPQRQICKFFLTNSCRYGDKCKNLHQAGGRDRPAAAGGSRGPARSSLFDDDDDRRPPQRDPFGQSATSDRRQSQSSRRSSDGDDGFFSPEPRQQAARSADHSTPVPRWPLTSYGPAGKPSIVSQEMCPDEIRYRAVKASRDNNLAQHRQQEERSFAARRQKLEELLGQPSTAAPSDSRSAKPSSSSSSSLSSLSSSTSLSSSAQTSGAVDPRFASDRFVYGAIPEVAPPMITAR